MRLRPPKCSAPPGARRRRPDVPSRLDHAILGASGSGKTTLLRLLAGFERADAGTIALGGAGRRRRRALSRPSGADRLRAPGGRLFPHLTVAGNVAFGLPARNRRTRGELLELVGLAELARPLPPPALRRPAAAGRAGAGARASARASCCSTSRSPHSTRSCATSVRGTSRCCARPARRRCSSPTTRTRRSRSPTASPSCATGGSSSAPPRTTSTHDRSTRTSQHFVGEGAT